MIQGLTVTSMHITMCVEVIEVKQENYTYPAKIMRTANGYSLEFHDFDCFVEEYDMESLIKAAQKELALAIIEKLDRGECIPEPSAVNEGVTYVNIWLPYYRNNVKEVYVRKSVTIPQWLDILAKERDLNFSSALVYGLKNSLGLDTGLK